MAGMPGFAEKGSPEGWDMAVGTVRGFRWWQMTVPLLQRRKLGLRPYHWDAYRGNPCADAYGNVYYSATSFSRDGKAWDVGKAYTEITGMHGGSWRRPGTGTDGRYKAACTPHHIVFPSVIAAPLRTHTYEVPDPGCGCGFWAYWNGLPGTDFDTLPGIRYGNSSGYFLNIPLAGVIEGSGRTIIGEKGFRCEYARITDLAPLLDTPCVYFDQDKETTLMGGSIMSPPPRLENPRKKPEFLPFLYEETGIPPAVLAAEIQVAVSAVLGSESRWHADVKELLKDALRDENYAVKPDE